MITLPAMLLALVSAVAPAPAVHHVHLARIQTGAVVYRGNELPSPYEIVATFRLDPDTTWLAFYVNRLPVEDHTVSFDSAAVRQRRRFYDAPSMGMTPEWWEARARSDVLRLARDLSRELASDRAVIIFDNGVGTIGERRIDPLMKGRYETVLDRFHRIQRDSTATLARAEEVEFRHPVPLSSFRLGPD